MTEASLLRDIAVNSEKSTFLDELRPYMHSNIYWRKKQLLHVEKQVLADLLNKLSSLKQYLK